VNVTTAAIAELVDPIKTWNPRTTPGGNFVYVDLSAIDQNEKTIVAATSLSRSEAPSRARQIIRNGDIIISTVRPNLNGVAPVTKEFDGATASTGFCVLRPQTKRLDSSYLMHWVRSPKFIELMVKEATGASYPAISDRIVKSSSISLPSLDEQRRIAAILDKADALRRKRRRALDLLDNLGRSIFLEMFGDLSNKRDHFKTEQLADCCASNDDIRCGPFGTQLYHSDFRHSGVPLWGIKHINAHFDFPTAEFLSSSKARELRNYNLLPGDLVMTRKGTIGNVAIYPPDFDDGIMHSDLLRIRLDRELVAPIFMAAQLRFEPAIKRQISLISGGAIMAGINVGKLKSIRVFVPPIDMQRKFVAVITKAAGLRKKQSKDLELQEVIFSSLQFRAFSGQL
jgi:type I restriction enzyme S subunit